MGSCCSSGDDEKDKKFSSDGGDSDISKGPVQNRGCTDVLCIPILLAAQIVFIVVTLAGLGDGNPEKLYRPRDYRGSYCGVEKNWNGGVNTLKSPTLSYTMNVTATVDQLMKQMVCSTAAKKALVDGQSSPSIAPLLMTKAERDTYMCDCCLAPCAKCQGGLDKGDDILSAAGADIMTSKMKDLTDLSAGAKLFSPTGANGGTFSATSFWKEATKYFNQVCLPSCNVDFQSINATKDVARSYTYKPAMDDNLYVAWGILLNGSNALVNPIKSVIATSFTFQSLPESICPYSKDLCVPMPGMDFKEIAAGADYCTFKMGAEVVTAVGDIAASAFEGMGGSAMSGAATKNFGDWIGDFQRTIDSFIVVSVLSFLFGILFLVILRFTVGLCVWLAVGITILMFWIGGAFVFVLSGQCAGAGVFGTGQQVAVAIVVAGHAAVKNKANGVKGPSELLTAALNGTDYRGGQRRTTSGKSCLAWNDQTIMPMYNSTNYPSSGLNDSTTGASAFCRNPYNNGDAINAKTIWCVTSDVNMPWEECLPIGVIQPLCSHGYEITDAKMRVALYYSSFVIWVMGLIWVVVVICMVSRIRLAISLNKVAAVFLASNPCVLFVPIVQAPLACVWCLLWFLSASFLISQVPDSYTPKGYYATYAEAYGTSGSCAVWEFGEQCNGKPGACTNQWPTGSVWKDNICEVINGMTKCYRCAPPRYVFDFRFAVSFFVFLWNNAFNIALGQIVIACSCSTWFFLPQDEKWKTPTVLKSIKTVFRYHIGSVAFGSFIVAVVEFIRYCMYYLEKQAQAQKNRVLVLLLKVVQCCIWVFEKCIKFLNKNAYIQIALSGKNFCTSAKAAFFLILRNALRFGTIAALGGIIHCIGFFCICTATCVMGYFIVRGMHPDVSPGLPCICFGFVGYIVAKLFMGTFGLAVDTSLQCFIACEEMKLSGDFVPGCLKKFVTDYPEEKPKADA